MTTADDARREAAFLYWKLSKNKQPQVPQELSDGEGGVIDKDRITLTALGRTAQMMLGLIPITDQEIDLFTEDGNSAREDSVWSTSIRIWGPSRSAVRRSSRS